MSFSPVLNTLQFLYMVSFAKMYQFVVIYELLTSLYLLNSSIKHNSKYPQASGKLSRCYLELVF